MKGVHCALGSYLRKLNVNIHSDPTTSDAIPKVTELKLFFSDKQVNVYSFCDSFYRFDRILKYIFFLNLLSMW